MAKFNLPDETFKKVNTLGDLQKVIERLLKTSNINTDTPVAMFSDEEGNEMNGILCLDYDGENIILIPWQGRF